MIQAGRQEAEEQTSVYVVDEMDAERARGEEEVGVVKADANTFS